MIRSQGIDSTRENVFEEGERFFMSTESVKVEGLETLRRERAGVVCSKLAPHVSSDFSPERNCFVVATQLLQSLCNLTFGVHSHRRFGTTMSDRPFQSVSCGLER